MSKIKAVYRTLRAACINITWKLSRI